MAERLSAILFPDLNPFIGAEFVSELTAETTATTRVQSSTRDIDLDSDMQTDTEKAKKPHEYKPRVHLERVPKEESHWYRRYLQPSQRSSIERGETNDGDAKDKKLAKSSKNVSYLVGFELAEVARSVPDDK